MVLLLVASCVGLAPRALAGDWPMARGDGGRSGTTEAGPTQKLVPAWSCQTPTPRPAWPGEARGSLYQKIDHSLTARAADDVAPTPLLVGDIVVFATTHDSVQAVELATGKPMWRYACGGPVRYAPVVSDGVVYVGSDDGCVHAVDLKTGKRRWVTRIGPEADWIAGNGRLIHPCPVRTGLLVEAGVVYVTAGLFPIEGVYIAALSAADGTIRWRREMGASSPQGYLVAAGAEMIVPFGRAGPWAYRVSDGESTRSIPSASGTFAVVRDGEVAAGPGATGSIQGSTAGGQKLAAFPGRQLAVGAKVAFLATGEGLVALDRALWRESKGDLSKSRIWTVKTPSAASLIVAGDRVFLGGDNQVEMYSAANGQLLQAFKVSGVAAALAANEKGLLVGTTSGAVQAFLPKAGAKLPVVLVPSKADAALVSNCKKVKLPAMAGLGLLSPTGDPLPIVRAWAEAAPQWHFVVATDPASASALRLALAEEGLLGTRVSVLEHVSGKPVPTVAHLFNMVLADSLDSQEAERLAAPGLAGVIMRDASISVASPDPAAGAWTHQYGDAGNTCATNQKLTGSPRLKWFGGHGPERMPDRHTRCHAPLAAAGLLVSVAENGLIATDANNGTIRWMLEVPNSMRYVMPYDAGYVALRADGSRIYQAVDQSLWIVDARTGSVTKRLPCPVNGLHWGWVAAIGDALYGSAEFPTASLTDKKYELVDTEYGSTRPMVCSKGIFRLKSEAGGLAWSYATAGALVNPTLAADANCVCFVESLCAKAKSDKSGRLTVSDLLESAHVVCLKADTGKKLWEQPLAWTGAKDILGLCIAGDQIFLSSAESIGGQAHYHLRTLGLADGKQQWEGHGINPIHDLYHGQQVKRPVVLSSVVALESVLFERVTGKPWRPAGAKEDWILSRPGHACGGMTGADDSLLFRASNPTRFDLSTGAFDKLSPTRPGCWLNILPASGGILVPEASASCICEFPIQASFGFTCNGAPAQKSPDIKP